MEILWILELVSCRWWISFGWLTKFLMWGRMVWFGVWFRPPHREFSSHPKESWTDTIADSIKTVWKSTELARSEFHVDSNTGFNESAIAYGPGSLPTSTKSTFRTRARSPTGGSLLEIGSKGEILIRSEENPSSRPWTQSHSTPLIQNLWIFHNGSGRML